MRYRVPLLLCALLVCSVTLGALPVAGQPAPGETHLEVQLQDNGDAEWSVTVAVPIRDEEDREDFQAFATAFEEGESDIELGVDVFERAASEAAPESGREMEIDSVRRESEIRNETDEEAASRGLLRVVFTWRSFARVGENDTIYVDDAFNTSDGTWLPALTAEQSLTIRSPPGYGGPTTSPIGAESGDLHWEGPQTFEPGYFTIVYPPSSTGPVGQGEGLSTTLVVGALLLSGVALLVGVYLLVSRRSDEEVSDDKPQASDSAETSPAEPTSGIEAGTEEMDSADTDRTSAESVDETEELDLLSDEERVEHLLEQNGGRMKQATIVKETGWSNAKVSQLLSAMDEADRIDKLRIGRENLISLPGEGVGDIDHEPDNE